MTEPIARCTAMVNSLRRTLEEHPWTAIGKRHEIWMCSVTALVRYYNSGAGEATNDVEYRRLHNHYQ